nr:odorant receptor 67a-like [Onthophagus taurus]
MGLLLMLVNLILLKKRNSLSEMTNVFSDFTEFGAPQNNLFFERNLKFIIKLCHYGGFLFAHVVTAIFIMLRDNKLSFVMPYYTRNDLNRWEIMLILLFHIYSVKVTLNLLLLVILLYCYSMILIVVRIKHLNEIIGKINLTRNKKRNFKILRPIVLYHQHIFKMFQFATKFFNIFMVPTKFCVLLSLTLSSIDISMRNNLISFFVFIPNFFALFVLHTFGQKLSSAAESVVDSVYDLNWYEADVSTRKDILILLCMSQRKLAVELPMFGQMSHAAATNDYKNVYIFFNWLLKITQKKIF